MQSKGRQSVGSDGKSDNKSLKSASSETSQHLASIDRLLGAAFELMKQTPTIDGATFEQARQLRVRIRRVLSVSNQNDSDTLPTRAPELFKDRKDKDEDPIAFTKRTYAKWLGRNLCRADLKKLDVKLYNALYNLDNPSKRFDEIGLLTKKALNDRLLNSVRELKGQSTSLAMLELTPAEKERVRLFNLARRRKQRADKT